VLVFQFGGNLELCLGGISPPKYLLRNGTTLGTTLSTEVYA